MARESEMIRNGGGLIDVTLCDGFLYCASVFSKSIAKATFSFPYVLDPAFGALYHVHEVRRRAGDVMPYTFLLVSSEESVRRGSFFNKTTVSPMRRQFTLYIICINFQVVFFADNFLECTTLNVFHEEIFKLHFILNQGRSIF